MKIYCAGIFSKSESGRTAIVACEKDLASFSFFQRGSIGEFMEFFSKTLVERTAPGTRQQFEEQSYMFDVHVRHDGTAGVVITDAEYPVRVGFTLINQIVDEFLQRYPREAWTENRADMPFPELKNHLQRYQNPSEADAMMRVQKDLDETKIILHQTMQSVLDRGEKIEDLVTRSDQLSSTSKAFYKTAKKTNSCCVVS
eukprot:m.17049 g.17049  ORF g.17049 m.17049 type:complete len:199 (-) comp5376_c0_seq1:77-673(-)